MTWVRVTEEKPTQPAWSLTRPANFSFPPRQVCASLRSRYAKAWAKRRADEKQATTALPTAEAPIEVPNLTAKTKPRKITRRPMKLPAGRQRNWSAAPDSNH